VATVTSIQTARGREPLQFEQLLTPAEVAKMFRVDPKTVTRWAKGGLLESVRTPGGHRRYKEASVRKFLADWQTS
jgi:excisionase family DNA binding protein